MKVGVLTVPLSGMPLDKALDYLAKLGVEAVEIGTGGFPGNSHCNPEQLLSNKDELKRFKKMFADSGIEIGAFSCHGNPVHPNGEEAKKADNIFCSTVLLAEEMGVGRVVTFSGCPGDRQGAAYPNWVTCPWPEDFLKILDYQWNSVLIPYWTTAGEFAKNHGVDKICLEMHPGFCVYNTETLLKLRKSVGNVIGANFDPSHLFWQGIDPVAAIKALGEAVHYFHAKDCKVDEYNKLVNGVLDTKHYGDELNRSWIFRTIGYGHDVQTWKNIISTLRMVGYDDVISIEHEDGLMSVKEGLEKAVRFLQEIIISEKPAPMWWA
jgi:sugar phosphate isomerase/epimerase